MGQLLDPSEQGTQSLPAPQGAALRVHLEQVPGYAPLLNPQEGIWNDLKRVEMGNLRCRDLDHLQQEVLRARERLRHTRHIMAGVFSTMR